MPNLIAIWNLKIDARCWEILLRNAVLLGSLSLSQELSRRSEHDPCTGQLKQHLENEKMKIHRKENSQKNSTFAKLVAWQNLRPRKEWLHCLVLTRFE